MMAARITDMTAHGGTITGPGAPNVLIGKMVAARMGDMHMCPMVTPGMPPVPHVGGPIVGGCPTVLIGKAPAARQGDMCVCVGPPSSIVIGCPTVLIGSGGGGGGGGGGASASQASAAKALKEGKIKPVEGTETFPVDIQAALAQMNKYCAPEEVAQKVKEIGEALAAAGEQQKTEPLTIKDIIEILKEVEKEEGYEAARHFASHLNYGKLTDIAKAFISGENSDPDNDPNLMPTRFMLLYGMDDNKIKEMDDHPDSFEGEEHKINVKNLRRGLKLLGYDIDDENGPFDDKVWVALVQHLASLPFQKKFENVHTVTEGDDLGSIAKDYGIISWKYLYEINKEVIGDNPDLLSVGTELQIPQWDDTQGDEKIKAKGAKLHHYVNGLRYQYVWVPFSVSLCNGSSVIYEEVKPPEQHTGMSEDNNEDNHYVDTEMENGESTALHTNEPLHIPENTEYLIKMLKTNEVVCTGILNSATEIATLLPHTCDFRIGVHGIPLMLGNQLHVHPDDLTENSEG
ncbi:PAAR domain-containing protein [Chitinispirillales bacterium ANBcel5]|uniref:PAAR domain-containing protein n=1 Tax=Cellulosispirillum alkaliphilum TaxID=3039283 RepID=UPI002A54E674|nr:PAAR domain-containing protein [Chitinispirillales bacterium ANBcel5]